ncbi:hypothetical protein ZWY2020_050706 [Hordeum vulgare]|nr:hypothetical protein ZWY2020_050706 [Hordeum vulgare]
MVWEARREGVRALLVSRFTPLPVRECVEVQLLVESCPESDCSDTWLAPLCTGSQGRFSARATYALHRLGGFGVETTTFLWSNRPPSCIKFFGWLLTPSRVHTRDLLLRKTILTTEEAGCPCCEAGASVSALHLLNIAGAVSDASPYTFILLCCWRLWKRRITVVFRDGLPSLSATLKACCDDKVLWWTRMKAANHTHIDVWLSVLRSI